MFGRKSQAGGFELARTTVLEFEGSEWDGAEVEIDTLVSLGEIFEIETASAALGKSGSVAAVVGLLLRHTHRWNLQINGKPVPLTRKGMESLPVGVIAAIMTGWQTAVVDVPAPLGHEPESGPGSPERDEIPPQS